MQRLLRAWKDLLPVLLVTEAYPRCKVHPLLNREGSQHDRLSIQSARVDRALADARERGQGYVELAPPLGNGPAEAFAARLGFVYRSSLWQLRLDPTIAVPPPSFPAGYTPRAFQPGADDEAYLELVNVSFEDHPTPMDLSLDFLRLAHSRPGFEAAGIAVIPAPDDPGRLVAFCRTILADEGGDSHFEISTLGVLPGYRGLGLGLSLLRWGIHHLRSRGAGEIVLTVEGRNERALAMYERTGFVQEQEWPRWARAVSGTSSEP